jgi:hypothetical protein
MNSQTLAPPKRIAQALPANAHLGDGAPGLSINRCSLQRHGPALLRQSGRSTGPAASINGQV